MTPPVWWRRQLAYLDFCLSALMRRRVKNIALLGAYALIVFVLTSIIFFAGALRREATSVLADAPEIVVQRMGTGRYTPIPLSYRQAIEKIRGVQKVTPRFWGYYFHPAAKANYTVMADSRDVLPGQTKIGAGVERSWKTGLGREIFFKAYHGGIVSLKVVSVLPKETELVSADLIVIHPDDFKALFDLDDLHATDLVVAVRNAKEVQTVAEKIAFQHPDTRTVLREEMLRTYGALFDWRSGYMLVLMGGTVLAFFIFALDKATGLSAEERGEIAVLKAVGWDTADVLALKFYEGLVISLSAFLLGALGAYLHVYMANGVLFSHALKGWGVLFPQLRLIPSVNIYQLAVIAGLTVFPYALITIVPAWRAATVDPETVMRQV